MKLTLKHSYLFIITLALGMTACNTSAAQPATEQSSQLPVVVEPTVSADTAPVQAPAGLNACTLLTKADAEAILGQPVKEPEFPIQGSETFIVDSCKYRVVDEASFDHTSLIVTVPASGDVQSAQIAFDTDKSTAEANFGAAPVDVPGLGDTAYWVGGTYGNQLGILKGNVHLILTADTQKGDTPPQPLIDLAQTILSRLP
jgi:hypothetical protein